jgi:hypothetical protein
LLFSPEFLLYLAGLLTGIGLALLTATVRDTVWILRYFHARLRRLRE